MSDAVDKADQAAAPAEHVSKTAQRKWASQAKKRNQQNVVTDTWYELVSGHKLLLCKRKKSGSVYRLLIGSTKDSNKERAASLKGFIAAKQKSKEIRVRI